MLLKGATSSEILRISRELPTHFEIRGKRNFAVSSVGRQRRLWSRVIQWKELPSITIAAGANQARISKTTGEHKKLRRDIIND